MYVDNEQIESNIPPPAGNFFPSPYIEYREQGDFFFQQQPIPEQQPVQQVIYKYEQPPPDAKISGSNNYLKGMFTGFSILLLFEIGRKLLF